MGKTWEGGKGRELDTGSWGGGVSRAKREGTIQRCAESFIKSAFTSCLIGTFD